MTYQDITKSIKLTKPQQELLLRLPKRTLDHYEPARKLVKLGVAAWYDQAPPIEGEPRERILRCTSLGLRLQDQLRKKVLR